MIQSKAILFGWSAASAVALYWALIFQGDVLMSWWYCLTLYAILLPSLTYMFNLYYNDEHNYSFVMFFFLFFFGFAIEAAYIDLIRADLRFGRFTSVGQFNFGREHYFRFWSVVLTGTAGIFLANLIFRRIRIGDSGYLENINPHSFFGYVYRHPYHVFMIWFLFAVALELLMWRFELGIQTKQSRGLPFGLVGAMVYTRNVLLTLALGFILNVILLRGKINKWVLALILIEVIIFTVTSLSKKGLAFHLLPILLYFTLDRKTSKLKLLFWIFGLIIGLSLLLALLSLLRSVSYSGQEISVLYARHAQNFENLAFFLEVAFKRLTQGYSQAERSALFHDTAARVYRLDSVQ